MAGKRPCMICRRWFDPHPRAGPRQRACSKPECQRERHRRACADWRRRNPDYDAEDRLRRRVQAEDGAAVLGSGSSALDRPPGLQWDAVQDAVGLQVGVVIEEAAKVLAEWVRDAVAPKILELQRESRKHARCPLRDGMDRARRPP